MKWRSLEESSSAADTRSLREQLAERKELIARYVPAQTQAVHSSVTTTLKQSGVEEHILTSGQQAPLFELPDHHGNMVSLPALLTKGKVIICFFRGRWCPFCVAQLEAMNQAVEQIQARGSTLVAISPQTVQQSSLMAEQHRLRFALLSDASNRVARQFGLVYRVPEAQQAIYRRAFINLPFANGDDSWELPIPATYVVGRDGIVLFASANADYTERPEPAEILEQLRVS